MGILSEKQIAEVLAKMWAWSTDDIEEHTIQEVAKNLNVYPLMKEILREDSWQI